MNFRKYALTVLAVRIVGVAALGWAFDFGIADFTLVCFLILSLPAVRFYALARAGGPITPSFGSHLFSPALIPIMAIGTALVLGAAMTLERLVSRSPVLGVAVAAAVLVAEYGFVWNRIAGRVRVDNAETP